MKHLFICPVMIIFLTSCATYQPSGNSVVERGDVVQTTQSHWPGSAASTASRTADVRFGMLRFTGNAPSNAPPEEVSVQDKSQELAKQLANPLASLISVPVKIDYNSHIGPDGDGSSLQINIQPVIPFSLNDDWLVISRTIVPITFLYDIPSDGDDESGIGDVLQSFFFSPTELTENGWTWGVGPVALLPTASPGVLGADQWAVGPTGVLLKQEGPWTVGFLANHLWSVENKDDQPDINSTYCEPWVSYTLESDTTFSLSTETIYDWTADEFSIPIVFTVEQLLEIGGQYISINAAVRYWADSTEEGPQDLGFQLGITFLFPF